MAKKAPRAPAGSVKVLIRAANFIKRNGPQEAAKYLKISEATARKVRRAIETGKPLGSVITSQGGLDRWKARVRDAPKFKSNRAAYLTFHAQNMTYSAVAEQAQLPRETVISALRSFQYRIDIPPDSKAIRQAIDDLSEKYPYYSPKGFIVCPGGLKQARSIEGAENGYVFRTGFRDLDDIDDYLDVVFGSAREFFMILVNPPDSQGRIRYSAFDIRPPGTREMPPGYRGLLGFHAP